MSTEIKIVREKTFNIVKQVAKEMADLVRPTFGPKGNRVIISTSLNHESVDDGFRILAQYEDPDPVKQAIVKEIRQVSSRTNDRGGDGTTGATIVTDGILTEAKPNVDGRKLEAELQRGLEEAKDQLRKSAKQIKTKEDLKKVAMTSFNNEPIAEMVADVYFKLGKDASITVGKSPSMETRVEMNDGPRLETGYISQYMVTNSERMEAEFDNPYILITDYRLTQESDLAPIMEKMNSTGKKNLLIVADNVEQHALAFMVKNLPQIYDLETKRKGIFPSVAVAAGSSNNRKVVLEDLAMLTGAKMFTESKGDKLELAEISDLGRAEKIVVRKNETVIIGPKGQKFAISKAINDLKLAVKNAQKESDKEFLEKRLGMFTNRVATINVGGATDSEKKAVKEKVDDAVHAVKNAYNGGVVCGGGLALARIKTSSIVLNEALQYPSRQILENAGISDFTPGKEKDFAINVVTGKVGNFMDIGVVDPVEVLIAGLESAVSIASALISVSGIICEAPKKPPVE